MALTHNRINRCNQTKSGLRLTKYLVSKTSTLTHLIIDNNNGSMPDERAGDLSSPKFMSFINKQVNHSSISNTKGRDFSESLIPQNLLNTDQSKTSTISTIPMELHEYEVWRQQQEKSMSQAYQSKSKESTLSGQRSQTTFKKRPSNHQKLKSFVI